MQAEYGRYDPSKAKFSGKTLIAHKYLEGTVKSTSKEELKGRETARGESNTLLITGFNALLVLGGTGCCSLGIFVAVLLCFGIRLGD